MRHHNQLGQKFIDIAGFHVTELPLLANPDAVAATMSAVFDLREQPLVELYALGLGIASLHGYIGYKLTQTIGMRVFAAPQPGQALVLGRNGQIERSLRLQKLAAEAPSSLSQASGG